MLSDSNIHESHVLETAFNQNHFVVIQFNPSLKFYVKLLQYAPEVVFLEMPPLCKDQLRFIELVRKHKRFASIPIIGFGDIVNVMVYNNYRKTGINSYIARPLKFSIIINSIEKYLNKKLIDDSKPAEQTPDSCSFLFSKDELPLKKIEFMTDRVSKLLAFPFTATKVMSLSNNDNTGAKQLSQVIISDPTISAQILRMANSVFFASLNRRISSIHDAIVRIGFSETKRIVISMAVMDLFDKKIHNAGFNRTGFWFHSISCAIIAEHIARRGKIVNGDDAFLSGLLHDLGILLMDEYFPEVLSCLLNNTADNASDFISEEKKAMSITHIDYTVALFDKWKIPVCITRGIAKKEKFRIYADDMIEESQIGFYIGIAESLVKSLMIGQECDEFVSPVDNELFVKARLPAGFNESFIKEILKDIEFYQKFLKLDQSELMTFKSEIENFSCLKIAVINIDKVYFIPPLLYLRQEGVTVQEFHTIDKNELHEMFDIIFVWYSKNQSAEELSSLTDITRRKNDSLTLLTAQAQPVLLIVSNETDKNIIDNKAFNIIPQSVDMRYFDHALAEIIDGVRYDYFGQLSPQDSPVSVEH